MFEPLFGPGTLTHMLRGGLEETSATHKAIARRVASALESSANVNFSDELGSRTGERVSEADLQRDMSALADTQLRFEADAQLLREAYQRLRAAIRTNA